MAFLSPMAICAPNKNRFSALLPFNIFSSQYYQDSKPQIREQVSGPEISYYEKSILGCGLGWTVR